MADPYNPGTPMEFQPTPGGAYLRIGRPIINDRGNRQGFYHVAFVDCNPSGMDTATLFCASETMLAALKSAEWMLARDQIDPQKMVVLEGVQAAIRAAGGKVRYG
jgi:hypothetical protein